MENLHKLLFDINNGPALLHYSNWRKKKNYYTSIQERDVVEDIFDDTKYYLDRLTSINDMLFLIIDRESIYKDEYLDLLEFFGDPLIATIANYHRLQDILSTWKHKDDGISNKTSKQMEDIYHEIDVLNDLTIRYDKLNLPTDF